MAQSSSADRVIPAPDPVAKPAYTPLTTKERLSDYLKSTVSPRSFLMAGFSAGWGQLRDRPREWQEGGEGFGKRYASAFGEHVVRTTLLLGAASAFHEDNRFLPSGETGVKTRLTYALKSSFQARHEDGSRHVSASRIVAFAGAALLSRLWQPHSTHTFRSAGVNFATSLGVATGVDVAREFWPR